MRPIIDKLLRGKMNFRMAILWAIFLILAYELIALVVDVVDTAHVFLEWIRNNPQVLIGK